MSVVSIKTKPDSAAAYAAGKFGNRLRTYNNWNEIRAEPGDRFGLMYRDPRGGGSKRFVTNLDVQALQERYYLWVHDGAEPKYITVSDALDCSITLLQGEVMRSEKYFDLTFTRETDVPNRPSMWRHKQVASGLKALMLLQTFLWPKSYDNLVELFDLYPNAVIEFSAVSKEVGLIPGHNTIFWELREY